VPEQTPGKPSILTSTSATGAGSRSARGTEKGSGVTGAGLSAAGARTKDLVAQPAAGAAKPASTSAEVNNTAMESGTESARSSRPARSINATKPDAVPTGPLPGLAPAAIASPTQALPATAVVIPVAQSTDERAQMAQAEFSAGLSTDQQAAFASASFGLQLPGRNASGNHAEAMSPAQQQSAEGAETTTKPGQASPGPSLSGSSGPTHSETEAVGNSAPSPAAMLAEGGKPLETPASAHSLAQQATQAAAQNANPGETPAPSQAPSQTLVSNPYQTPTFVQSQEQVAKQLENQGVNVVAAAMPGDGLNPMPVAVSAIQSGQLSALPSVLDKPGSAGGGTASALNPSRTARGAGNFDSVQQMRPLIEGQSAVDASAMTRASANAGGVMSPVGVLAGASSVAATGPDSREAFATLDAADAPGATTWIHAGAQRAEAGYQDPTLGWVGVRADLSGGGVHAQLVPGSADAAQVLGSHLAGLNAYLAEHHTPVETLTLTAPEGGRSGLDSGQGMGEGMQQGTGPQTQQEPAQGVDASSPSGPDSDSLTQSSAASAELPAIFGDMGGSTQAAGLGGYHISVMA